MIKTTHLLFTIILLQFCFSISYGQGILGNSFQMDSLGFVYKDMKIRDTFIDSTENRIINKNPVRKKNFTRAGIEWFLAQAFPASFNYFITKDPYSRITFKNFIQHQRPSAWDWDDNKFRTNQFDHVFHGQLYFNAFRSKWL